MCRRVGPEMSAAESRQGSLSEKGGGETDSGKALSPLEVCPSPAPLMPGDPGVMLSQGLPSISVAPELLGGRGAGGPLCRAGPGVSDKPES